MEEKRKIGMDLFIYFFWRGGREGVFEDVLKFESCRIM